MTAGRIQSIMAFLQAQLAWMPAWLGNTILLGVCCLAALGLHHSAYVLAQRFVREPQSPARALLRRLRGPTRLAALIAGMALCVWAAVLPAQTVKWIEQALLVGFIFLLGWMAQTAVDVGVDYYLRRYRVEAPDNLLARKHVTQMRILRRTANVLLMLVTASLALMTLPGVRQYGVSLLASAGAAGIVVGLALQPFLTNLIAGVQLAITQPIRLDDAVIVEGEWGNIEEINSTYVVVRLWDWRRLVLPLTYFIQKPFQNWTRQSSQLIGTAYVYVDYTAPIEAMRNKLQEIAKASPLWDGQVVNLAVTDATEHTLQVRCLVSARNAGEAFDLRCFVRERMVAFLRAEYPSVLPRGRMEIGPEPGAQGAPGAMAERPATAGAAR